jgi:5-methylthioribose kinase
MMPLPVELLTPESVVAYLAGQGLVDADTPGQVEPLGGGVSNVVLAVTTEDRRVVVKQALPQLRVAQEWLADPARANTEAAALRLAGRLTPGAVPSVIHADPERFVLVIAAAPEGWEEWKRALLAGTVDPVVAARVGELAARWHAGTTGLAGDAVFDQPEAFDQLRLDPYYRAAGRAHPDLAATIGHRLDELTATRACLVHGDLSPKNVLVGPDGLWVIDFEVAHVGHPAFDLAFMLNHLFLKAARLPAAFDALRAAADALWSAYERARGLHIATEAALDHLGVLMLARVDGKSPAEYLDEPTRVKVREVARSLTAAPPSDLDEAWSRASRLWR